MSNRAIASTAALMATLILSGCAMNITGLAVPPDDGQLGHRVEWVTDPESDATEMLAVTVRGDGEFKVGADFPPGIYLSGGSRRGSVCSWQRVTYDPSGARTVVKSDSGTTPQLIVIKPTDSIFSTQSCQPWELVQ